MSFTRVSKSNPCPICKHPDWCTVGDYGTCCMRVESAKPVANGGWFHSNGAAPGVPHRPPPPPAKPTINFTAMLRDWSANTTGFQTVRLAEGLGLSVDAINAMQPAWAPAHNAWAFPMRDGYGNVVGIRLRNERGKFAVRGSRQGVFLAAVPAQKTLFVCEGPTDTAAAVQLGLFAVGRPNCNCGGLEIRVYARQKGCSRVVMVADNDRPGLLGARKVGAEIRLPHTIYIPPTKDLREFVQLGGTRDLIEAATKNTVWIQ